MPVAFSLTCILGVFRSLAPELILISMSSQLVVPIWMSLLYRKLWLGHTHQTNALQADLKELQGVRACLHLSNSLSQRT